MHCLSTPHISWRCFIRAQKAGIPETLVVVLMRVLIGLGFLLEFFVFSERTGEVPELQHRREGGPLQQHRGPGVQGPELRRQEAPGQSAQGLHQDPQEVAVRPPLQRLPQRRGEARAGQGGRTHRAPGRKSSHILSLRVERLKVGFELMYKSANANATRVFPHPKVFPRKYFDSKETNCLWS